MEVEFLDEEEPSQFLDEYIISGNNTEDYPEDCKMMFALTQNALSFVLTTTYAPEDFRFDEEESFWPRNTQLIKLSEKAGLVGGLMDFDISLAACSYDGNSVRITPRAAFSLVTLTQVVTPFIMEEKRNWQRIVKYHKRGFDAFILDPNCRHETQCTAGPFGPQVWQNDTTETAGSLPSNILQGEEVTRPSRTDVMEFRRGRDAVNYCGAPHNPSDNPSRLDHNREILALFENDEEGTFDYFARRGNWSEDKRADMEACMYEYQDDSTVRPLSSEVTPFQEDSDPVFCCGHKGSIYSFVLFEKFDADALEFFAQRDNWSEVEIAEMDAVHPWLRVCCRDCRYEYEPYVFMKRNTAYGERIEENVDELLRGESTSIRQNRRIFDPSFYSGGVFDGRHSRSNPYLFHKAFTALDAQLRAEKARYFVKHSTYDGYSPRFTFGANMHYVFAKASRIPFPDSKRNPVGLNPERFVGICTSCRRWLLDQEFGTEHCDLCEDRKQPSAKG